MQLNDGLPVHVGDPSAWAARPGGTPPPGPSRAAEYAEASKSLVRTDVVLAALLAAASAGLGLWRIGAKSIWDDEAATVFYAHTDLPTLVARVSNDANGAFYYLLAHFWGDAAGWSEGALRAFSALSVAASVAVLYWIARYWLPAAPAAVVATVFMLTNLVVRYGQEARMYGLALLLILLATLVLLHARSRKQWLLYGLLLALAFWTHEWTATVAFAHFLWLGRRLRESWPAWSVAATLSAPMVYYIVTHPSRASWAAPISDRQLWTVFLALAGGSVPLLVVGIQCVLRTAWVRRDLTLPLLMATVPIAVTVTISLVKSMLVPRYLLFALPGFAIVCTAAAMTLSPRRVRVVALCWLIAINATTAASWYGAPAFEDIRSGTRLVVRARADAVVVYPGSLSLGYNYYVERLQLDAPPKLSLHAALAKQPTIIALMFPPSHDPEIRPFLTALKTRGYSLVNHRAVAGLSVDVYRKQPR